MATGAGEVNGNDIREVAELFAGVSDRQEMLRLLDEILTPAELRDLALRWRLVQRLHAGVPQRRIAGELGISLCKITRGSRILKQKNGVIRGILERKGRGPAGRKDSGGGIQEPG
jgi:TrpR family trp operon transcriptional repressor